MKSHVDLPAWFVPLILLLVVAALCAGYFKAQQGRIIWDPERIGVNMRKGGYRSWTLTIADGQISDGKGNLKTVTFKRNREGQIIGYRRGFKWPVYGHTDLRGFAFTPLTTNAIYSEPIHLRSIIKTP